MKKILLLGASKYQIPMIHLIRQNKYFVIACDGNPQAEGLEKADIGIVVDIKDYNQIKKIASDNKVDVILPINEVGVMTAAFVNRELGLNGINLEAAELSSNKEMMRKAWITNNIPCPIVEVASTIEEIYHAIRIVGFPCILKPAHGLGGGSKGVVVVNSMKDLKEAIEFSRSFYEDKTLLIESFVSSISEHSAEVLVKNGECQIIAISDKVKSDLPYRVDKSVIYPSKSFATNNIVLKNILEKAIRTLKINIGIVHVEFANTKAGIIMFELAARFGGGSTASTIVPYCTGVNEVHEVIKVLSSDNSDVIEITKSKGCVYHFLTPPEGIIEDIIGLNEIKKLDFIIEADIFVTKGSVVNKLKTGNDRIGYLIAIGETNEIAYQNALLAESKIDFLYKR